MIISNLITVNHTSNLYPTKVCMFILHNLRDSSISPSTFTLHFMKEVVLIYQWLFIRTCIHNQEINTNYEIVNCKTFFVSSVTRYLLSIRCPTTHTISSPEIINQLCSFSIILSLLSIKKSLIFLRLFIPNGKNESPSFQRRRCNGKLNLEAST